MQRTVPAPADGVSIPRPVISGALCAVLMAATAWAVLAAGWAQNAGGAVVVAVAAAVEAALLARAGVARWVPLLLAPVLALAAIVPTTLGAMPFDGNPTLGHTITRYFNALTSGLGSSADWPFTVGLCAVLWLCGYWVGWLAMRERRGVLAVLPVYAVLATNVLNTHNLSGVALPEAVAVCFTLLVIADAHLDRLQTRWSSVAVSSLPGTQSRFAGTVAVVSVVLTLVALLLPPVSTVDISSRFFSTGGGGGTGAGHGLASAQPGTIQFNGSTQPGGALLSQPHPVLVYTVDTTATVYLRVVDDTLFAGGNWYPDRTNGPLSADWAGLQYPGGTLPRDRATADGAIATRATRTVHSKIVIQADPTGNTGLTPVAGEPEAVDQAGIAFGLAGPGDSGLLTIDSVQLDAGLDAGATVQTTATTSTATVAQLRSAGVHYPSWMQRYTDWADDYTHGATLVHQIAQQWTQGLTNPYDMATAIETRLRTPSQFTYTLNPPDVPPNVWPIVYFLTTSHRGYCQYFASTMGLMLRTLGIPTRLVNGYGPGTAQALNGRPGVRQSLVTTSDAHTWVEAYFPTYGWIPFEPTPPSADGNYVPFPRGTAAAASSATNPAVPTPDTLKPGFNDIGQTANDAAAAAKRGVSPLLVVGAMGGAIVFALLVFAVWLALPRTLRGAWRRLEVLGRVSGMRRQPWETYSEYVKRFTDVQPRVGPALEDLSTELGRAQFSRDGADRATSRRALSRWRSVVVSAPRLFLALREQPIEPASVELGTLAR